MKELTTLPRATQLRKVEALLEEEPEELEISSTSSSASRAEACRIDSDSWHNSSIASIDSSFRRSPTIWFSKFYGWTKIGENWNSAKRSIGVKSESERSEGIRSLSLSLRKYYAFVFLGFELWIEFQRFEMGKKGREVMREKNPSLSLSLVLSTLNFLSLIWIFFFLVYNLVAFFSNFKISLSLFLTLLFCVSLIFFYFFFFLDWIWIGLWDLFRHSD